MPFRVRLAIGRGLMKTHRIGERNLEEIVVARGELFEDIRKTVARRGIKRSQVSGVSLGEQQHFKRPYRPERNEGCEMGVLDDHARPRLCFQLQVVTEQASAV